jgi:hypothetical protein
MPERIPALQNSLAAAEAALEELSTAVRLDEQTLRRTRNTARVAVFGLLLDITLTVLVGWGLVGVTDNQTRVNNLQSALQAETDRNSKAQCAFIALFLQFEPKTINNPAYTPEQHALQAQAYTTLRQIGTDLQCPQ